MSGSVIAQSFCLLASLQVEGGAGVSATPRGSVGIGGPSHGHPEMFVGDDSKSVSCYGGLLYFHRLHSAAGQVVEADNITGWQSSRQQLQTQRPPTQPGDVFPRQE